MVGHRGFAVAGLCAVVLGVAVAATMPTVGGASAPRDESVTLPRNGTGLPAESVAVRIEVRPDGSAVWAVQYRVELDDENATARFETVGDRIESRPLEYTGPFAEMMERATSVAAEETGRSMEIRNVTVRARKLPTRVGVVTYRFEWTAFASRSGDRLAVGDALVGFFLSGAESTLLIQWPAGFEPERVVPEPDERRERAVLWEGPVEFAPDEPRVVLAGGGSPPFAPSAAVAVIAVLVAVGAVAWRLRRGGGPTPSSGEDGPAPADVTTEHGGEDSTGTSPGEDVPVELLSDGERVLRLLDAEGGRMRQQQVVAELDWSETKASQVVRDLRDEGEIEVYRLGRENVLALPGEMDV